MWTELDDVHSAVGAGDAQTLLRLLTARRGLAGETLPESGETPLHVAARVGSRELVDILLSFGADAAAKNTCGVSPAVVAAASGHQRLAAVLERAAVDGARRKRVAERPKAGRRCSLWLFWQVFASSNAGTAIAPWIWALNAMFAAYAYCTRLAPWAPGSLAVHSATALHACIISLYVICWALWMKCASAKPTASTPAEAATQGYRLSIKALANGKADPELERWLSHAHASALGPTDAVCPVTGAIVADFDHHCAFVANSVGRHNARHFLAYCIGLTAACALYSCLTIPQWRHITRTGQTDLVLEAALLDMCLGTAAVGQLALWQLRLAGAGVTAHRLRRFGRPKDGLRWNRRAWRAFWATGATAQQWGVKTDWHEDDHLRTVEQLHSFLTGEDTAMMRTSQC